jgi:hypothetical protein
MFAGSQYERVPWYENAKLLNPILGGAFATLILAILATLIRWGRKLFFSKRADLRPQPGTLWLTTGPRLACFAWTVLGIITGVLLSSLDSDNTLPTRAFDKYFMMLNFLSAIAIFFSILAIGSGVFIWRRPSIRSITRVKFSLVAAACLFLSWFAIHWNIIGAAHRF